MHLARPTAAIAIAALAALTFAGCAPASPEEQVEAELTSFMDDVKNGKTPNWCEDTAESNADKEISQLEVADGVKPSFSQYDNGEGNPEGAEVWSASIEGRPAGTEDVVRGHSIQVRVLGDADPCIEFAYGW
ncbi:hypothetical protein [Microbacterium sp. 77mftsu3.1]|uniref:hypothetical protein n=1 Tax=Microbacterium sp. 77mftsu3.1 TaxID=1761802 RepID=UPI000360CE52|nr:hypothetical protein [Microbacterium sp. 77mftsu3.1]SDH34140.1 hypothetical protein SAMN04488590_3075 [Microbacterium sp. 77mftsu3.1]